MRDFYAGIMEFRIIREIPDRWIEFQVGATLLTLRRHGAPYDGPPSPIGSASLQLAFRVPPADLDGAAKELVERGVELLQEPSDLPDWGHRTLFFADPENNVIEIYAEI